MLDVDAGVCRLKIRERNMTLPSGTGGLRSSGVAEDRVQIPAAIRGSHKVEARLVHADAADFKSSTPQGKKPDRGPHRVGMKYRLYAVGRIFIDREVCQNKAGPRQKSQFHR